MEETIDIDMEKEVTALGLHMLMRSIDHLRADADAFKKKSVEQMQKALEELSTCTRLSEELEKVNKDEEILGYITQLKAILGSLGRAYKSELKSRDGIQ